MSFIDFIFPKKCLACGQEGNYICENCLNKVQVGGFRNKSTYSIWRYQGVIRKAILRLKYNFNYDIANCLADKTSEELKSRKIDFGDVVLIPIPLHKKRQRWRGFNQSEILGKKIAQNMEWVFEGDLLFRRVQTIPQANLNRTKRRENIKDVFELNSKKQVRGRKYIIFDDVLTTGATISEAQKMFLKAGASEVYCFTIAST